MSLKSDLEIKVINSVRAIKIWQVHSTSFLWQYDLKNEVRWLDQTCFKSSFFQREKQEILWLVDW